MLGKLNHDQAVRCGVLVLHTPHLLEQQRPKWLPQARDQPECAYRLAKPNGSVCELLVKERTNPWVNEVEIFHRTQIACHGAIFMRRGRRIRT